MFFSWALIHGVNYVLLKQMMSNPEQAQLHIVSRGTWCAWYSRSFRHKPQFKVIATLQLSFQKGSLDPVCSFLPFHSLSNSKHPFSLWFRSISLELLKMHHTGLLHQRSAERPYYFHLLALWLCDLHLQKSWVKLLQNLRTPGWKQWRKWA